MTVLLTRCQPPTPSSPVVTGEEGTGASGTVGAATGPKQAG